MNNEDLPSDFSVFPILCIGNNIFANVQAIVTIGGVAPLLIGGGRLLRVWLSVPTANVDSPWRTLVADNVVSMSGISLKLTPKVATLALDKTTLLSMVQGGGPERVNIMKLDLRPVGLNIYFDSTQQGLHIFGSALRNNHFNRVPVAMVLDALP